MTKPFSEASERNQQPILEVLTRYFTQPGQVLEIGSGTGQHSVYMARQLPHLVWQPTDVAANLPGIAAWGLEAQLVNCLPPIELDINADWPPGPFDYVFSANTVHIVSWAEVERMFAGVARVLAQGGLFALYGPFNYDGTYTSTSNARFDQWLQARDPRSGIRDFETVQALATQQSLHLLEDVDMPANNRLLLWRLET